LIHRFQCGTNPRIVHWTALSFSYRIFERKSLWSRPPAPSLGDYTCQRCQPVQSESPEQASLSRARSAMLLGTVQLWGIRCWRWWLVSWMVEARQRRLLCVLLESQPRSGGGVDRTDFGRACGVCALACVPFPAGKLPNIQGVRRCGYYGMWLAETSSSSGAKRQPVQVGTTCIMS
jgi:hypothetical protein